MNIFLEPSTYRNFLDALITNAKEQKTSLLLAGIFIIVIGLVLSVFVLLTSAETIALMGQEVTIIAELPTYTGAFQTMTSLMWCVNATICFLTALFLWNIKQPLQLVLFWGYMGAFLSILMLDDVFGIHEALRDKAGISDLITFGVYGILVLVLIGLFHSNLLETSFVLAILAGGLLASSVAIDILVAILFDDFAEDHSRIHFLLEDGPKIIGLVILVMYFVQSALNTFMASIQTMDTATQ